MLNRLIISGDVQKYRTSTKNVRGDLPILLSVFGRANIFKLVEPDNTRANSFI